MRRLLAAKSTTKAQPFASAFDINGALEPLVGGKAPLRSGATTKTASLSNVTNYTRGINGLVIDIAGLDAAALAANPLTPADFIFRVYRPGNPVNDPSQWSLAPALSAFVVTPAVGNTPARVRFGVAQQCD